MVLYVVECDTALKTVRPGQDRQDYANNVKAERTRKKTKFGVLLFTVPGFRLRFWVSKIAAIYVVFYGINFLKPLLVFPLIEDKLSSSQKSTLRGMSKLCIALRGMSKLCIFISKDTHLFSTAVMCLARTILASFNPYTWHRMRESSKDQPSFNIYITSLSIILWHVGLIWQLNFSDLFWRNRDLINQ